MAALLRRPASGAHITRIPGWTLAMWTSWASQVTERWDSACRAGPCPPDGTSFPPSSSSFHMGTALCLLAGLSHPALTRKAGDGLVRLDPSCPVTAPSITPLAFPGSGRLPHQGCPQGQRMHHGWEGEEKVEQFWGLVGRVWGWRWGWGWGWQRTRGSPLSQAPASPKHLPVENADSLSRR